MTLSRAELERMSPADLLRLESVLEQVVQDAEAGKVPWRCGRKGCDGKPLAPGAYRLRALVGYGSDALNNAQGGASGAFVMASEPVDLRIT